MRINRDIPAHSANAARPASLVERVIESVKRAHARRPRQEFWQALRQQIAPA